jgi:hypothetical protein
VVVVVVVVTGVCFNSDGVKGLVGWFRGIAFGFAFALLTSVITL